MAKRRVLVQWLGHSDLRAMAGELPEKKRQEILEKLPGPAVKAGELGPTRTLLTNERFEEVLLLSTYPEKWINWVKPSLQNPLTTLTVVAVELPQGPTDYAGIFAVADRELGRLREGQDWAGTELCLHLSPGTSAMAAVWLLLGKTRYPATFYETYQGKSWISEIPFELIDVIPEVLRDADAQWQHLAAETPGQVEGFEQIVGSSRAIREAVGRARRAALRNVSVLLLGESGTGKEMFARAIHRASPRRNGPFQAINCAALSQTLLESELFGHKKHAFTGAESDRAGAFEAADGGTLFLDEIGECALETQAKLLRVLQPEPGDGPSLRRVRRLGENKDRAVDARIIAATNRDLQREIMAHRFRDDLYYRLATVTITLPPLRERKSDLPLLAECLLGQLNAEFQREQPDYLHKKLSGSATAFVKSHHWPGNIRQLYNVLVQAMIFTDGDSIGRKELAAALGEMPDTGGGVQALTEHPLGDGFELDGHLNAIHASYLRRAMGEANGVLAEAARLLGLENYQTLDARLKRFGIKDRKKSRK